MSLSIIVLWHLLCYPLSTTMLTANDMDQLKATLWKEIGATLERIRSGPHGWIAEHVDLRSDASCKIIGFEDMWFIESKTANEKTANKMAGRHGEWFMVIGDESSSIPDLVMTTLSGAMTGENNRMLLTSQGTRNAGFFYNTHHSLSEAHGGAWRSISLSSFDSPFVSVPALQELWDMYDEDERNVRLLGLFPQDSSNHMMNRKTALAMYDRGQIIGDDEPYGWFVAGDIASGEGQRDKSAVVIARVIGSGDVGLDARRVEVMVIPLHTNKIRVNVFAGAIHEHGVTLSNPTYVIDAGGLGVGVCQSLEDLGCVVNRVNWGNPCFRKVNKDRYINLRAQAMHHAARAAKDGRLSIRTLSHQRAMVDQSSRIPKTFNERAKIRVPPKHSKEWDGLKSPDLWDAVCFCFLENADYIVADDRVALGTAASVNAEKSIATIAENLFGGIDGAG